MKLDPEFRHCMAWFVFGFVFGVLATLMSSCAYGEGYWLFPQDSNGYHFDPCLYPEKVRPENREQYRIECP